MKGQFHIGVNGVKPCSATVRACRYQDFDTEEEAQSCYEQKMKDEAISTITTNLTPGEHPFIQVSSKDLEEIKSILREASENSSKPLSDEIESMKVKKLVAAGKKIEEVALANGAPSDQEVVEAVDSRKKNAVEKVQEMDKLYKEAKEALNLYGTTLRDKVNEDGSVEKGKTWWELFRKKELTPEENDKFRELKEVEKSRFNDLVSAEAEAVRENHTSNDLGVESYSKRSEIYLGVLSAVGVEFAKPGDISTSEDSHQRANEILNEVSRFYPKSWVEASNCHPNQFAAKMSENRAHYMPVTRKKNYVVRDKISMQFYPEGSGPDLTDPHYLKAFPIKGDTYTPESNDFEYSISMPPGSVAWVVPENEISYLQEKPSGNGWKQEEINSSKVDSETGNLVKGKQKFWVRSKKARLLASTTYLGGELTINENEDNDSGSSPGMRVALHEFAHRVEYSNPAVLHMEKVFLTERSLNEIPSTINGQKGEIGYRDHFANHYIGRIYEDGGATEILSMGMESIFTGSNGGLSGAKDHRTDAEYKHFILGMLASSIND